MLCSALLKRQMDDDELGKKGTVLSSMCARHMIECGEMDSGRECGRRA